MLGPIAVALVACTVPAVHADAAAGERKAQLCLICHKPGNQNAYVPTLEGQPREYLVRQIKAFQQRKRSDTVMQTNVMTLSDRDVRDIADYFASRKPLRVALALDREKARRGQAEAEARGCAACHRPDFSGQRDVPRLAGMEPRYAAMQIDAFSTGRRAHPRIGPAAAIPSETAETLAQYFALLE